MGLALSMKHQHQQLHLLMPASRTVSVHLTCLMLVHLVNDQVQGQMFYADRTILQTKLAFRMRI